VFHAKLGTQADRVGRLARLAVELSALVPGAERALVEQAALLCKADLVTGMVGEFPELQGVMGRYYALSEELPMEVAEAIGDHYAPAGPNDRCPGSPVSITVALADKLDALASFWSIGEKPTGSRDPYALRRAGLGIIRIIVENKLRLPLRRFLMMDDLMAFIADRLKVQMREKGVRHDIVDAVFSLGGEDDLVRLLARVEAVQSFLETEAGKNLLTAYARAANIVRAEERKDKTLGARIAGLPDAALLEQVEEKAVASSLAEIERTVKTAIEREDFAGAMRAFASLRAPIDSFFEKVTVNVTDKPELRLNRLKLLNQIRATMDSVADFSRIEG
jgi:glycyl-tRNA synthetase beta chain